MFILAAVGVSSFVGGCGSVGQWVVGVLVPLVRVFDGSGECY